MVLVGKFNSNKHHKHVTMGASTAVFMIVTPQLGRVDIWVQICTQKYVAHKRKCQHPSPPITMFFRSCTDDFF